MSAPHYDRPMRRGARQLAPESCLEHLRKGEWGVLCLADGEGNPYGVPLNYALWEEGGLRLIFHCAREGLKLELLAAAGPEKGQGSRPQADACFTVVTRAETCPAALTTRFESVLAFGPVRRLEGEEAAVALRCLGLRFSAGFPAEMEHTLAKAEAKTVVLALEIRGMTGKFNPGG